jgi:hypothetical protein
MMQVQELLELISEICLNGSGDSFWFVGVADENKSGKEFLDWRNIGPVRRLFRSSSRWMIGTSSRHQILT